LIDHYSSLKYYERFALYFADILYGELGYAQNSFACTKARGTENGPFLSEIRSGVIESTLPP
jgi:hypothetical protein